MTKQFLVIDLVQIFYNVTCHFIFIFFLSSPNFWIFFCLVQCVTHYYKVGWYFNFHKLIIDGHYVPACFLRPLCMSLLWVRNICLFYSIVWPCLVLWCGHDSYSKLNLVLWIVFFIVLKDSCYMGLWHAYMWWTLLMVGACGTHTSNFFLIMCIRYEFGLWAACTRTKASMCAHTQERHS